MSLSESFSSLIQLSSSSLADLHLNPLYVLPVTAVLILCLLVYAFGFKSTSPVPPASLTSLIQQDAKKNASSKKKGKKESEKSSGSSSRPPVVRANGQVPAGSKSKQTAHPEAQQRIRKQKTQTTSPKAHTLPAADPVAEEEDGGDWVPVLTKKKAQKQKQEAEKGTNVPVAEVQVAADQTSSGTNVQQERNSVPVIVDVHVPAKLEVENWDSEEPIAEKEYKSKKKSVRRGKEPRSEFVHQAAAAPFPDATADAVPDGKVVKDKITSEILANYNSSVLDTDKNAAAAAKKKREKEKRRTKAQAVSQNFQPEKLPVPVPAAVTAAVIDKSAAAPAESVSSANPIGNSFKELVVAGKGPAESADKHAKQSQSSEATDVTDGSDPSDGEFKVVRKRKARRE